MAGPAGLQPNLPSGAFLERIWGLEYLLESDFEDLA